MENFWKFLDKEISEMAQNMEAASPAKANAKPISKQAISTSYCQWSVLPNDAFLPSGPKIQTLAAGVYSVVQTESGPAFVKANVITDDLLPLPDSANERVLESMTKFWQSKEEYTKRHVVYKRGILLEGPAGSGKTSTVNLLTQILVKMDGIVLLCTNPSSMAAGLDAFRRIEPDRNLIVVYEDIDEIIEHSGEHALLALLDGEFQIDNVVHVATTNFPEKLGARICNRPSRFDERIYVGMPNEDARETYFRHILRQESISEEDLQKWIKDTDSFSVAHLRELAVAVFCLKQPYDTVLKRLKGMQNRPKAIPEFRGGALGGFKLVEVENE